VRGRSRATSRGSPRRRRAASLSAGIRNTSRCRRRRDWRC
jgi:hypothetical protein